MTRIAGIAHCTSEKTLLFCSCMWLAERMSQPRRGEIVTSRASTGQTTSARKVRSGSRRIITRNMPVKRVNEQSTRKTLDMTVKIPAQIIHHGVADADRGVVIKQTQSAKQQVNKHQTDT